MAIKVLNEKPLSEIRNEQQEKQEMDQVDLWEAVLDIDRKQDMIEATQASIIERLTKIETLIVSK